MIIKILGFLDIVAAVLFWIFASYGIIPSSLMIIVALYLLVKGVIFVISKDIASFLDIIFAGVVFLSLSFTLPLAVIIISSLFLLQKGVFSLIS